MPSTRQRRHILIRPDAVKGLRFFRFRWESETANSDGETELIFGDDGQLLGVDPRPADRREPGRES
ncbi:MAG: hypothetical protein ABR524_07590 [Thermoanaerobaculia bacterium]